MKTQTPVKEKSGELPRREFLQWMGTGALGLALTGAGCTSEPGGNSAAGGSLEGGMMPRPTSKQMRGLFPIGSTPFTEDDKLDLESLAAEVKFCNRGGVHGFVWPQIASGWTTLSEAERIAGAEAILAAGKGGDDHASDRSAIKDREAGRGGAIRQARGQERGRCHRVPAAPIGHG